MRRPKLVGLTVLSFRFGIQSVPYWFRLGTAKFDPLAKRRWQGYHKSFAITILLTVYFADINVCFHIFFTNTFQL